MLSQLFLEKIGICLVALVFGGATIFEFFFYDRLAEYLDREPAPFFRRFLMPIGGTFSSKIMRWQAKLGGIIGAAIFVWIIHLVFVVFRESRP